jgi:hypothetical protein
VHVTYYDHALPAPIVKRRRVRNECRRMGVALPNQEETFLLDSHEAMKDCIELTDQATAKVAQPEGFTISMVRYALQSKTGIYKRKTSSS